jgi:hypothetical protein
MEHEPRYIVQLLRLLMYTPNAANTDSLIELCRSQTLLGKIAAVDLPLVQEIKQLRKAHPDITTSTPRNPSDPTLAPAPVLQGQP